MEDFQRKKQRIEFHRKVSSTWCLEQRNVTFLFKGKANLASQNIGKKESKETQGKNSYNIFSSFQPWKLCFLGTCDIFVFLWSKHPKVFIPVFSNPIVFDFLLYSIPAFFSIPSFCIPAFQTGLQSSDNLRFKFIERGNFVSRILHTQRWWHTLLPKTFVHAVGNPFV